MKSKTRKALCLFLIPVIPVVIFIVGPRISIKYNLKQFSIPDDVDKYLDESEKKHKNIISGAEKKIFWAGETGKKTKLSIIYIHGFTACRQEVSPVFEEVAKKLNANIFFTRLTGHGINPEKGGADFITNASLEAWINDTMEAYEIGKKIGDKIIACGTSTGASLVLWLALQKKPELLSMVLISPNIRPKEKKAELILLPWGNIILKIATGKYQYSATTNELKKKYWLTKYNSAALLPLMAVVKLLRDLRFEDISIPSIWFYTENDETVSVPDILKVYYRTGGEKLIINVEEAKEHVLTGKITSPQTTKQVTDNILNFLNKVKNKF